MTESEIIELVEKLEQVFVRYYSSYRECVKLYKNSHSISIYCCDSLTAAGILIDSYRWGDIPELRNYTISLNIKDNKLLIKK